LSENFEADVIVCGAGPVGLLLATEVALSGRSVIVLDAAREPHGQSRAMSLQPRTAEILDLRGLMERVQKFEIGRMLSGHFSAIPLTYDGFDTRYPYQAGILQARIEETLRQRLVELGGEVRRGFEVTGLDQDEDGVTVHGPAVVSGRYLVGCDGSRSTVRTVLGVAFVGTDPTEYTTITDVDISPGTEEPPIGWTTLARTRRVRPDGSFASVVFIGEPRLYRFVYSDGRRERADVSNEEVAAAFASFYGDSYKLVRVRYASRFSNATRQAQQYQVGRVFLAGDAAHVHPPTGGQGLNLGLQDAFNLGWKIAAVLGGADATLLDTYHAERHPVGAAVVANTLAQAVLSLKDAPHQALRSIVADLLALPEANHEVTGMITGLGIDYGGEGIVGTRLPDFDTPTARAGEFFHDGNGVLFTVGPPLEIPATTPPVIQVKVTSLPWPDLKAVLVRPDGYVCWMAGTGTDLTEAPRPW
jgi:2-polyprenyl-6-methoxyphenol hydroxylase-like FAD-dependent oxidoreductase